MERHINAYQGMNQDAGYDRIPNTNYVTATDIRITTTTGESMGSWTNIKGNKESFVIPTAGDFGDPPVSWTSSVVGTLEIIGYTTIRNRIILFVADDSDQNGWIYDVQYDTATREILPGFPVLKYYNNALNFSKANPIEAIGRYESESIQRVYWTDYNNYLRSLNIEDPFLNTLSNGIIDIFPDVSYTQPLLQTIFTGGSLLSGLYQVAYRLRTNDGKETLISPPSNLIHLTASAETLVQSAQYVGSLPNTNTNKALNIIIDTSGYLNFDTIDIFTIFHEDYNGVPTVNFVETKTIVSTTTEFIITGNETESYPIEFFSYILKSYPFKTCKTLTQKDSSLVIANTKGGYFSAKDRIAELGETFDFDVFRYRNVATVITTNNDKFNVDYNIDAHWLADWHNNKQYKYQSDGATLGGESANINFKFHLEPMTIIGNSTDGFSNVANVPIESHDLNDTLNLEYYNTTFPSNSSPFISGLLKGYKRGESYRFGIIFYNKKGEASFVEHLADVKFPDISDQDSAVNASGTNYFPLCSDTGTSVVGYSLGIEFNIDFSTCPDFFNEIESYQIVRVQRADIDKRRLTTGVLKTFTDVLIDTSAPNNFDFNLPQGSGAGITTLHLYADTGATSRVATRFNLLGGVATPYGDVVGDFLALHTPEFSYNFENVASLTTSTTNACVLITGAYSHTTGTIDSTIDLSGPENLGNTMQDYRVTLKNTYRLDSITTENIKILGSGSNYIQMTDTAAYTDNVVGPISSAGSDYYLRNYYATYNITGGGAGINDPQAGAGTASSIYEVSKGATGVMCRVDKLLNDPITSLPLPLPTSGFDYFDNTFVKPESPILLDSCVPIFDILLPKAEIYGGTTDFALQTNIFIPASPVIDKTLVAPKVFGGDIFLTTFSFQSSSVELDTDFYDGAGTGTPNAFATSRVRSAVLPVESSINVELAYGSTLKTGVKYTEAVNSSTFTVLRQETNNTVTTNGLSSGSTFKMYDHNTVYSRENYDVVFFTKTINTNNGSANDIRAHLSNVKINEEITDSWTKFGINNYYDIDDYGPINKILNWKDTVYFVQDKGVGTYAINSRAITTTNDGIPTQLGTGQGFGKHLYISKEHGSIHQYGVKATNTAIYFLDAIHRKLFSIAVGTRGESGIVPLSEKGLHSFFQALPAAIFLRKEDGGDNPILRKGISIGKDKINDEIIFTFLGSGIALPVIINYSYFPGDIVFVSGMYVQIINKVTTGDDEDANIQLIIENSIAFDITTLNKSLVFDELAAQFSSMYSVTPQIWIDNGDILMTSGPLSKNGTIGIYTHNIGNWGEFYGNIQEASITLVINPNADINKVLRTLEYNSIVRNDAKIVTRTSTITGFRIQNQVQDTGVIPFSSGRIKRRFDKWRIKIPRDTNSVNQKGRLRSSYFIVTLYFDNQKNQQLIMNNLMSYYDVQIF